MSIDKIDNIYVRDMHDNPLMPCHSWGRIRRWLKSGKVVKVSSRPYIVQLTYEIKSCVTQDPVGGMDPGRVNIGLGAASDDGLPLFLADAVTRNKDIPVLMSNRRTYRNKRRQYGRRNKKQRRAQKAGTVVEGGSVEVFVHGAKKAMVCKVIRPKEAKMSNRFREAGWLTPTARQLLETHLQLARTMKTFVPMNKIVVELNRFDFQKMENPHILPWQYQMGPLHGYDDIRDAIEDQQGHKCLLCQKKPIEHCHHVVPRCKGGSDTIANIAGLCKECHDKVHTDDKAASELARLKNGLNKKYHHLSVLNQIIPYLLVGLTEIFDEVYITTGRDTAAYRAKHGMSKDHCLDAYAIACSINDTYDSRVETLQMRQIRQFRRHDRQSCQQEMVDRWYCLDGKKVCCNRHKRIEQVKDGKLQMQKADSIEEYRLKYPENIVRLTVPEHKPRHKDMNRIMPGAVMKCGDEFFVMTSSKGRHNGKPDYYIDTDGNTHRASHCTAILRNRGLCFV